MIFWKKIVKNHIIRSVPIYFSKIQLHQYYQGVHNIFSKIFKLCVLQKLFTKKSN